MICRQPWILKNHIYVYDTVYMKFISFSLLSRFYLFSFSSLFVSLSLCLFFSLCLYSLFNSLSSLIFCLFPASPRAAATATAKAAATAAATASDRPAARKCHELGGQPAK